MKKFSMVFIAITILLGCMFGFMIQTGVLGRLMRRTLVADSQDTRPQQTPNKLSSPMATIDGYTTLDKDAPVYVVETEENNNIKYASGHYINNQRVGYWEFYHPNGALQACGEFVDNRKSGIWKYSYVGGQLMAQGQYDKGVMNGVWASYYPNGNRKLEGSYNHGLQVGQWLEFPDENCQGSYWQGGFNSAGHFDKIWKYYDHGILAKTITYDNGIVVQ